MTSKPPITGAAALLGVLLLWRLLSVESDASILRAELAKSIPAPARNDAGLGSDSAIPRSADRLAASDAGDALEPTREELQQAKDRIAELEGTVDELSAAWNKFAEAEEQKRVKASMRAWGPEQAIGRPPGRLSRRMAASSGCRRATKSRSRSHRCAFSKTTRPAPS